MGRYIHNTVNPIPLLQPFRFSFLLLKITKEEYKNTIKRETAERKLFEPIKEYPIPSHRSVHAI